MGLAHDRAAGCGSELAVAPVTRLPVTSCRLSAYVVAVIVAGLLAGCAGTPNQLTGGQPTDAAPDSGFVGRVVDPPLRLPDVALTDTNGRSVDLGNQPPGTITALFFGYTNCQDVCPTTMADLAAARRLLPTALKRHVSVVFVTVDPRRDTPSVLRRWLDRYDQDFIGLIGSNQVIHRLQRALFAPQSVEHTQVHSGGARYSVDHSATVYLFAPDGSSVIYTSGATPDGYATDFAKLLKCCTTAKSVDVGRIH